MATASAPKARALAKSAEILSPPVITRDTCSAPLSFRNFLALYRANMEGTDVEDLTNLGAAPVAPALPSIVDKIRLCI